jgi:Fe-S-cluster containining protein
VQWEPAGELDCRNCGACCREAYDAVEIGNREVVLKRHPELVIATETHRKLKRDGDRCAALRGGTEADRNYTCSIYTDRPRSCREFTLGSANCLDARRRVGLSL